MKQEYTELLATIADEIKPVELEKMKFLSKEFIPYTPSLQVETNSCFQSEVYSFFCKLEAQSKLGIDDLDWLEYLVKKIENEKLHLKVVEFRFQRSSYLSSLSISERESVTNRDQTTRSEQDEEKQQPEGNKTSKGIITVRCIPYVAGVAWGVGSIYLLNRYKDDPQALVNLVGNVVVPVGTLLKSVSPGSINFLLQATDLNSLKELWKRYKKGQLKEDLERVLVTSELKNLANGEQVELVVELSEEEYRNACLDLIIARTIAQTHYKEIVLSATKRQASRSLPDLTSLDTTRNLSRDVFVMEESCLGLIANRGLGATNSFKFKSRIPDNSKKTIKTRIAEEKPNKGPSDVLSPRIVLSLLNHIESIVLIIKWLVQFHDPHRYLRWYGQRRFDSFPESRLFHDDYDYDDDDDDNLPQFLRELLNMLYKVKDFLEKNQIVLHPERVVNTMALYELRLEIDFGKELRSRQSTLDKKEIKMNKDCLIKEMKKMAALLAEVYKLDPKLLEAQQAEKSVDDEDSVKSRYRISVTPKPYFSKPHGNLDETKRPTGFSLLGATKKEFSEFSPETKKLKVEKPETIYNYRKL